MQKNIIQYLILVIVALVGFIFWQHNKTELVSTCLYDNTQGTVCSDCDFGNVPNRTCLAVLPEGQIIGEYRPNSKGEIIVTNRQGEVAGIEAEFGFDRVFKDNLNTGGYFVLSTNRENSPLRTFDKVFLVLFGPNQPFGITKVINEPGFGDYHLNQWFYIPMSYAGGYARHGDFVLKIVDALGEPVDEFKFGPTLVTLPHYHPDMYLYNFEILNDGNILLTFGKDLLGESYSQYLVSPKEKTIKHIDL